MELEHQHISGLVIQRVAHQMEQSFATTHLIKIPCEPIYLIIRLLTPHQDTDINLAQ